MSAADLRAQLADVDSQSAALDRDRRRLILAIEIEEGRPDSNEARFSRAMLAGDIAAMGELCAESHADYARRWGEMPNESTTRRARELLGVAASPPKGPPPPADEPRRFGAEELDVLRAMANEPSVEGRDFTMMPAPPAPRESEAPEVPPLPRKREERCRECRGQGTTCAYSGTPIVCPVCSGRGTVPGGDK